MPVHAPQDERLHRVLQAHKEAEAERQAYANVEALRRLVETERVEIGDVWYDLPGVSVPLGYDIHDAMQAAGLAQKKGDMKAFRRHTRSLAMLLHRAYRPVGWRRLFWRLYNPFLSLTEGSLLHAANFAYASRMRSNVRGAHEEAELSRPI